MQFIILKIKPLRELRAFVMKEPMCLIGRQESLFLNCWANLNDSQLVIHVDCRTFGNSWTTMAIRKRPRDDSFFAMTAKIFAQGNLFMMITL